MCVGFETSSINCGKYTQNVAVKSRTFNTSLYLWFTLHFKFLFCYLKTGMSSLYITKILHIHLLIKWIPRCDSFPYISDRMTSQSLVRSVSLSWHHSDNRSPHAVKCIFRLFASFQHSSSSWSRQFVCSRVMAPWPALSTLNRYVSLRF